MGNTININTLECSAILYTMWTIITSFSFLLPSITAQPADSSVEVTVFYESLCPDSVRFVNEQLFPSWKKFQNELKVDLKPFGKAKFYPSGSSWDFTCQHGPHECYGNKAQACILHQVTCPKEYVPLIDCIMGSTNPPSATVACLTKLNIRTTTAEKVETCAQSDQGSQLLHNIGVETKSLDPAMTFVPWVLFNKVFDEEAWQESLDDLSGVLCRKFLIGSSKCTIRNPFK